MTSAGERTSSARRPWLGTLLRLAISGGVVALLVTRIDRVALLDALGRMPAFALLASLLTCLGAVASGVARWRLLLRAYGAAVVLPWTSLWRWYLIAMFYNLLPGAIGGDVYRGIATRRCFADASATRAVSVVFIERALGLSGLLFLSCIASLMEVRFLRDVFPFALVGLIAASAGIAVISTARPLARHLPARLFAIIDGLPTLVHFRPFLWALPLSVSSHLLFTLAGHVLVHSLVPSVTLSQSLMIFPLGALASYFPFTIAGAGARDVALVLLFAQVGVPRSDALATSLCLLACTLILACLGGFLRGRPSADDAADLASG